MALTITIPKSGVDVTSGRREYIVTAAELASLGAFTTGTITLDNLPAGAVVQESRIKHFTAVAGPGITATCTAQLKFNGNTLGASALDVFSAPSSTAGTGYITDITGNGAGLYDAVNPLQMAVTVTGANFSVVTAGEIHAWVNYILLG